GRSVQLALGFREMAGVGEIERPVQPDQGSVLLRQALVVDQRAEVAFGGVEHPALVFQMGALAQIGRLLLGAGGDLRQGVGGGSCAAGSASSRAARQMAPERAPWPSEKRC